MLLAHPNVQQFLFANDRFVRLSLQEQVVILEDADGETCRRPLEAFSSGERAFSYMLGSILQQRQATAQNHLLVLDEFGAFIEAGLCWLLESSVQKIDSAVILQLHVCLPFHLQERSGRSSTLPVTKKPHAYEKNTLHLPNTLREAPWKASCRALKNTSWQKDPPGSLE